MEIKSFRAPSMQEALRLVRQELGPGAAVLHTREVPRRGLRGWLGGRELELAASDGTNVPSRLSAPPQETADELTAPAAVSETITVAADTGTPYLERELPPSPSLPESLPDDDPAETGLDLADLQNQQGLWDPRQLAPVEDRPWIDHLRSAEVAESTIFQLCRQIQDQRLPAAMPPLQRQDAVRTAVAGMLHVGRDLDHQGSTAKVIAAIGPTGVGKTTTIAKLAARAKFDQGKKVGLVTVDTYRIAAVDQLQTYAEIMDLPMRVVSTAGEVAAAIASLADCDQIFIDTAGRSPRDEVQVQQLRSIIAAARPDETYLVLSAASSGRALQEIQQRFARIAPTALVITKLDEVETIGNALEFLSTASIPISYVTNGQDVPQAIASADAEDLARRIL